jgi:hypothetical protein
VCHAQQRPPLPDEDTATMLGINQPLRLQNRDGLASRVPSGSILARELALGRQQRSWRQIAREDRATQLASNPPTGRHASWLTIGLHRTHT